MTLTVRLFRAGFVLLGTLATRACRKHALVFVNELVNRSRLIAEWLVVDATAQPN